mgnify:CR=1 FL=1
MPRLSPVSWGNFVRKMRLLNWSGPYQQGKHPIMSKNGISVIIPNPHRNDIGIDLLSRILRQANIPRDEWIKK